MTEARRSHGRLIVSVALVSTALIAYEIVLMRRLLIEHWHHFGYLVISAALLGFGASGTLLAVCEGPVRRHRDGALWLSAIGLTLGLVLLPRAAATLPVSAQFIPKELGEQIGWWSLYWLAAAVPFLLGATLVGAAIMTAGPRVGAVYGVNLFGSGVGAVAGGLLASRLPVEYAYWPCIGLSLLATAIVTSPNRRARRAVVRYAPVGLTAIAAVTAFGLEAAWPPRLKPEEFKYAAHLRRLAAQGTAQRIARAADPHGDVEVYESPLFHQVPFLAISESPPPMLNVSINGNFAGSVFCIDDVSQASVMDETLMAFPYELISGRPRVLLLGETGGTNVWLARRRGAHHITVVQPNGALVRLLRGALAERAGHVLEGTDLRVLVDDPRAHLSSNQSAAYDLIQIVSLEGLGGGSLAVRGLAEDHLATVEGIAACLRRLTPRGVLSVCRGVQYPERENIRILATFAEALESIGVRDASRHVVQVRDYLGVCTLARRAPVDEALRARLSGAIEAFNLTPVWYDGLPPEHVNQPDQLPGPPGADVDWLHHAAREIFSPRRAVFYRDWLTNVRPPHDDSPFFWDFYKPGAVAVLRRAYRDLWLTRAELGRLFLYASLALAGVAAVALILAPLAIARLVQRSVRTRLTRSQRPPSVSAVLYFGAIGLGFMGIEMALISRAIRWLGDPVIASALIIGALLVLSGLGSLISQRVLRRALWVPAVTVALLAGLITTLAILSHQRSTLAGALSLVIAVLAAPLALLMGVPMPRGITRLAERAAALVPWAWGMNGVASVMGTSLALVLAMSYGYRFVFGLAAALYALAALSATQLGRHRSETPRA
jgi:predicted membrane-bound spermidine synthase